MAKIDNLFMTKTAEKHTLWGPTYLYSPYKGVTPRLGASEPCVYFCDWRAVTKFVLRAASTLKITDGVALRQVIWLTPPKQDNGRNPVPTIPAAYIQLCLVWWQITSRSFTWFSELQWVDIQGDLKFSNPTLWTTHKKKLKTTRSQLLLKDSP